MATEAKFTSDFIKPLVECYGQAKLPGVRIKRIWEKLKSFPDHILGQCADRIILNHDNFPGVFTIMNVCAEVGAEYSRSASEGIKDSVKCIRCRSQGVVIANNYAYKCTCQLGELLYPVYPLYQGQVHIQEKTYFDEDGNRIFEDGNYRAVVPPGCTDIRQIRTVVKSPVSILSKKGSPATRSLNLDDFTRGPA